MAATYYAYPSELPPTTPPQLTYLDGASIVRTDDEFDYDRHPSSPFCHPSTTYSCGSLLAPPPVRGFRSPSPTSQTTYKPFSVRSAADSFETETAQVVLDTDFGGKKGKMDMNMAAPGSIAAAAGIHTPLAQYAASMAVWLWFGTSPPPSPTPDSPMLTTSPLPHDPFELPRHPSSPLNPLQFHPSPQFTQFVAQMLQVTMVSHSVTIVALLYIYRLKNKNNIVAGPGTEQRPFIASLILSNKYLDDNTYTNKTWAELTGLPVSEITRMEAEFLKGLNYDLAVQHSEYIQWRQLLDGFIFSRDALRTRAASQAFGSPQSLLYTPNPAVIPSQSDVAVSLMYRARSASPPCFSPAFAYRSHYTHPSPEHSKKRSAGDAFADPTAPAGVYESMRRPARKAAFVQPIAPTYPSVTIPVPTHRPSFTSQSSGSSLARSSSLNRQIARLPGDSIEGASGRRGSAGHILSVESEADLRHAATAHAQMQQGWMSSIGGGPYEGYSTLVAPYERPAQLQMVPPEHLMFYTLAADPHPGQDGAPRKAILRYQDPSQSHPFCYPSEPGAVANGYTLPLAAEGNLPYAFRYHDRATMAVEEVEHSPTAPYPPHISTYSYDTPPYATYATTSYGTGEVNAHSQAQGLGYHEPEPAQFANNGPPGYAYDPHTNVWGNRWSTGSEELMGDCVMGGVPASGGVWRTRSEWSSPMPQWEAWRP